LTEARVSVPALLWPFKVGMDVLVITLFPVYLVRSVASQQR